MKKSVVQTQWYQAWWVDAAFVVVGLLLAYNVFIAAVDSGSLVQYFAAIVCLVVVVVSFAKSFKKLRDIR